MLSRGGKNTQKNYTKKIFTTQIITQVITHLQPDILECEVKWAFSLVQFSHSVVSDSLRPHESQHIRPPGPSQTPRVHSDSCPSSQWCHPAISSSVVPFSSCTQSLPASESFQWVSSTHRWPKYWSFSFSIIPSKEIPGLISFRMDWLDLLAVQGTLKSLLQQSIIMNRAGGGDGIPVELYQILKDDAVKVLHSICQQIWKALQLPQDWKRSVFIPIPKRGNAKECSNILHNCTHLTC